MAVYVDSCRPNLWCADPGCMMPAWLTVPAGEEECAWCVDDAERLIRAAKARGEGIRCSETANRVLAIEGVDL